MQHTAGGAAHSWACRWKEEERVPRMLECFREGVVADWLGNKDRGGNGVSHLGFGVSVDATGGGREGSKAAS